MKWSFIFPGKRLRYRRNLPAIPLPGHTIRSVKKIAPVIPLFSFLLLIACLQVSANVYGQPVTLSIKNASLETVFTAIRKQTGYNFVYAREILRKTKKINLDVRNETLEKVLELVFKDQPVTFTIVDKYVVVKEKIAVAGQPVTDNLADIRGVIVNEKGDPVASATVAVRGTDQSTMTSEKGEFQLKNVDEEGTLVVTSVGYEFTEWPINGKHELRVQLKVKVNELSAVSITVNTGYQEVSREKMVGSFSRLDSAAYHRRAGMNIIDRLDGTVTGVLFDKKGAGLQIRGISTLEGISGTSAAPLIIVDNFPFTGDIRMINQNDVKDITVLKDAAAASIWGSRAGNGVIVITTKKGRLNQPLRVSISSNITIHSKPDLYYYPRIKTTDFVDVEQFLFNKGFYEDDFANTTNRPTLSPIPEILDQVRKGTLTQGEADQQINALRNADIRNELKKRVYRNLVVQQHYINVSGGNNILGYTFSAGYNQTLPDIKGSKPARQFTINAVNIFSPIRHLELETGISFTKGIDKPVNFSLGNKVYPYMQLADAAGNSLPVPKDFRQRYLDTAGNGQLLDWQYRPLDEIRLSDNVATSQLLRLNFKGSYAFTNWLKGEVLYQYTQQSSRGRNYYSPQTHFTRNLINLFSQEDNGTIKRIIPPGGILNASNSLANTTNWRAQLNVNKSWNYKHTITALLAGEVAEMKRSSDFSRFYGYNEDLGTYASGLNYTDFFPTYGQLYGSLPIPQETGISENREVNRTVSLLGNISYSYDNRYTVYASARRDGANVFGVNTNNKWKPLWSVGANWTLSREDFYSVKWLPYLRFRVSFGYMGNVNNRFSGLTTLYYSPDPAPYTHLPYSGVGDPPNPDLRWEEVQMFNAGFDFNMFQNRLSGSFEVFRKKSSDVIAPVPFDPTLGIDFYNVNAASLLGKGFELSLQSKNTTGTVVWESRFGLSYAKTIVTEVYNGGFRAMDYINYGLNASKGQVAYGISSYRWAGLDPVTGDPQGFLNKQVSKDYMAIFNDSVENQVFHGSSIPLYSGYLGNSVTWNRITLSANITYRLAYYFRKPTISYTKLFTAMDGHADYAMRWQKPGDERFTTVPSMVYPVDSYRDDFYENAEVNVLRGDNIRLQDVRLQYDINKQVLKWLPFQNLQVFLYANNLNIILWRADRSKLDPDFSGGVIPGDGPTPRTWTTGITLSL